MMNQQAIHPKQIEKIEQLFSPSPEEIKKAENIANGYEEHVKKGLGAFVLDGKMIDAPVVKWAQKILSYAKQINKKHV